MNMFPLPYCIDILHLPSFTSSSLEECYCVPAISHNHYHCDCSAAAITWTLGGAAALLHLLQVCSETRLKLRGSDSESAVKMRAGVRIHLLAVKEWKPDSHQQVRSGVRGNSSASPLFRIEKKLAASSCPGGATSSCPPAWRQPPLVSRSQSSEIVQPHDCFK